jgi:hypothetical protein
MRVADARGIESLDQVSSVPMSCVWSAGRGKRELVTNVFL